MTSLKKEEVSTKVTLRQQPFATPEKVHDVVAETYKNLKTKLPMVQRSMSLYLANRDTEAILFRPIKVSEGMVVRGADSQGSSWGINGIWK